MFVFRKKRLTGQKLVFYFVSQFGEYKSELFVIPKNLARGESQWRAAVHKTMELNISRHGDRIVSIPLAKFKLEHLGCNCEISLKLKQNCKKISSKTALLAHHTVPRQNFIPEDKNEAKGGPEEVSRGCCIGISQYYNTNPLLQRAGQLDSADKHDCCTHRDRHAGVQVRDNSDQCKLIPIKINLN